MAADGVLETIARGLARGMSRREALRVGGGAVAAAMVSSPAEALARKTRRCAAHQIKCNGHCCPIGEVCIHPPPPKHRRKGRHYTPPKPYCGCAPGTKRCGNQCVHITTDVNNCGLCGHKCPPNSSCHNGMCVNTCPSATTQCLGGCVDLQTDSRNCGSCGAACAAGTSCANGTCVGDCPAGTTTCGASCVKLASDPDNCGACGQGCPNGSACVDGTCSSSCPPNTSLCGRTCATLAGDGNNCGSCGVVCAAGTVCANGTCSTGGCPSGAVTCGTSCCQGTGCCPGGGCQTVHDNGIGDNFYDCGSLGVPGNPATYSLALAQAAAAAHGPSASAHTCGTEKALISVDRAGNWVTWIYTGALAGRVHLDTSPICPNSSDPVWF